MRIFKGSECRLAPEMGYQYVCSIEILKNNTTNHKFVSKEEMEKEWLLATGKLFNAWKNLKDSNGKPGISSFIQ